jgi:hypothetical protein
LFAGSARYRALAFFIHNIYSFRCSGSDSANVNLAKLYFLADFARVFLPLLKGGSNDYHDHPYDILTLRKLLFSFVTFSISTTYPFIHPPYK